jgi:glycosyltransferase involved in cell wall biosynthesis
MLYDCIPILENLSSISNMTASLWFTNVLQNLKKETFYFCNSECTKNDFLSLFPNQLDKNKMFVTLLASSQYFFPIYDKTALMKVLEKYKVTPNINNSYLFSLCSIDPRKNLVFTIKCFIKFIDKHKIDNFYFYLGGASFGDYIDKYLQETSLFSDYQDKILQLGYIDDEDLNILYSNSLFFTFLSQYEGFGIPPLEAMQAGTPVICSNNSSLPEVVGDAAIMIDCNSEEQCIKAFEEFYFNGDLRREYIKKGLERSKLFSWDKTVKTMTDIIKARH